MFNKIGTSWHLMKQSFRVLTLDKELILFPIVAGIFSLIAILSFFLPFFILETVFFSPVFFIVAFAFYFTIYFITIFFNSALIGAANIRFNGGNPTLKDGLSIAFQNIVSILGWTIIAATVGVILNIVYNMLKDNFLGSIIVRLVGFGWSIATFFVIPAIVVDKNDPIKAITSSAKIVKEKFSETVISTFGFGVITFLAFILLAVLFLGLIYILPGSLELAISALVVLFSLFLVVNVLSATLNSILVAALYHYAKTGKDPEHWNLSEVLTTIKK